jgi:hypothetical protein
MIRGQETRLVRLERTIRPGAAGVFVAWGRNEEEASGAFAEACARGEVRKGDLTSCAVWPHADDLPPSRWLTFRQLSDREEEAILATLKRRIDFREEPRGPCRPDSELLQMSSDELFQCLAEVV